MRFLSILERIENEIEGNSKMAVCTVKESLHFQMVNDMKVNGKITKSMVKESIHGQMVDDMKVNGNMENIRNNKSFRTPIIHILTIG